MVRALVERDHVVAVLDNFSAGDSRYLDGLDIEIIEGDIRDARLVNKLTARYQQVVHLAAQTGVPNSLAAPLEDCETNVLGTLNVLEGLRQASGDGDRRTRFVLASSNAPLGRQPPPATEDKAPLPMSPYGASKLAGEAYALGYHGSWDIESVILRFANVYGPFSAHKESVVAKFIKDAATSGIINVDGDGSQTRDFIFVADLCQAIIAGLEGGAAGEVFQIATGVETSIGELSRRVGRVVSNSITVASSPARRGDIHRNYSQVSKAERVLGWRPATWLDEGLEITARWFDAWRLSAER